MEKLVLIAVEETGKVQQAGFRERLQDLARGLGITGFVENIIAISDRSSYSIFSIPINTVWPSMSHSFV